MIRKFVAQNFGFQLYDLLNGSSVMSHYNSFEPIIYGSEEEINNYQFTRLKKILNHCYYNVPFYKDRFKKNGLKPEDIKTIADFRKIPVLKREDLQEHGDLIFAQDINRKKLNKGSSSGSTGKPIVYFKDDIAKSAGKAAQRLGWELSGWELGLKGLHIWGNPNTVNKDWKRVSSKLKVRVFNHYKYPAYQLTEKGKFDELVTLINKEKYDFIDGYTNAIYLLADYIKRYHKKIVKPKLIMTTGENLQSFQRNLIEEVLGPVYDEYGCSEINGIAYECKECRNYHIIEPHVIVEFGNNITPQGEKPLIITDLDNYSFPLIRYENGDMGIPVDSNDTNCLVKLRRIKSISGRMSDVINLPNGGALSVPSFFGSMLLKELKGIKQYQIVRITKDKLEINIAVSEEFEDIDLNRIKESIEVYLGDSIKWCVNIVDKIEVSKTGKFKLLIDKTQGK